ncbi:two-component system sensor histidine kinase ComP [Gracilibacillus halotolerans]|uniref:histidine kinase n=1 Tax=Gracilibacillus halotolerans TaxID=74386 RepID=A0A841RN05_9BACI|nr:histidine kinase [Gracilibacillus halotolerans]MBB6512555.1 two-component system sensor histidine kinase ComP [Gracilibacillus halotolerans]
MIQRKKYTFFLIVFILLFSFLAYQNLTPYIGIHLAKDGDTYITDGFSDLGWGWDSGIVNGEEIVFIDGETPDNNAIASNFFRIEKAETITVKRDGELITYDISGSTALTAQYIFYFVFPLAYFLMNLLFSYLLIKQRIEKQSTSILIILFNVISFCYISASLNTKLILSGELLLPITFLLAPVLFIHFIFHYFAELDFKWVSKKVIYFLYSLAVIGSVLSSLSLTLSRSSLLITFLFIVLIIILILLNGYTTIKSIQAKDSFRWLFYSFLIALTPFVLLYGIPDILLGKGIIKAEIATMFIITMPAIYLYLLASDKLYQMKLTLNRLPYFSLISLVPALCITSGFYLLAEQNQTVIGILRFFIITFITIILFLSFKGYLDRALKTNLFVDYENYPNSLYRFSEVLKKLTTKDDILKSAQRELREVIKLSNLTTVSVSKFHPIVCSHDKLDAEFNKKILKNPLKIGQVIQYQTNLMIIVGEEQEFYYAILGKRTRKTSLMSTQQNDWLSALAYFTSIALENIRKLEDTINELNNLRSKSKWLSKLLFNISEKEHRRLANDIHDSFLQDLISLNRKIHDIQTNTPNKEHQLQLQEAEEEILDIIYTIRETLHELYPAFLSEFGLDSALDELYSKFRLRCNIALDVNMGEDVFKDLGEDHVLAVYRIVQELLTNATKHSQANHIELIIRRENRELLILYKDDGIGLQEVNKNDYKQMGIRGIEERVYSLDGSIQFTNNNGLSVHIRIPI